MPLKWFSTSLFHPLIFFFFIFAHPLVFFRKKRPKYTFFFTPLQRYHFVPSSRKFDFLSWLSQQKKSYKKFSFCFSVGGRKKFPFEKNIYFTFFCCHAKFLCPFVSTRFQLKYLSTFYVTGIFFFLSWLSPSSLFLHPSATIFAHVHY